MSIFYISNGVLSLKKYISMSKNNNPMLCSYLEYYLDDILVITDLKSNIKNKGYATILILSVLQEAQNKNVNVVELDDCSDRYNQKHNIYLKLGFKYNDEYGPEMTGDINHILKINQDINISLTGDEGGVSIFSKLV